MKEDEKSELLQMTILVIDDQPEICDLIEAILSGHGFEHIIKANSAKSAIEILEGKQRIDLLVCDMIMPDGNGFEIMHYIKRHQKLDHTPVILVSGTGNYNMTVRCIRQGAEDLLHKPIDKDLLIARVVSSLEKKHLRNVERKLVYYLEVEKQRAESVLYNVMPEHIARRLKEGETHIAELLPNVTVLFADIIGFTEVAAGLSAEYLVSYLNEFFLFLDHLAEEYDLEKIKTIGDNYMLGGGLQNKDNHACRVAKFARDAIVGLSSFTITKKLGIELRIGVNSGPVVAGIIGHKRPMFDLWGETVNMASRMESHGVPSQVQISKSTYDQIEEDLGFVSRGEIKIKGAGMMETFLSPAYLEESHDAPSFQSDAVDSYVR